MRTRGLALGLVGANPVGRFRVGRLREKPPPFLGGPFSERIIKPSCGERRIRSRTDGYEEKEPKF